MLSKYGPSFVEIAQEPVFTGGDGLRGDHFNLPFRAPMIVEGTPGSALNWEIA